MGRAKTRKILQDTDGKEYLFDRFAFDDAMCAKTDKEKKITKGVVIDQLRHACAVSEDAVKNWLYGKNSIPDMEMVKKAAGFLEIDYHDILTPVQNTQEERKMRTENKIITEATVCADSTSYPAERNAVLKVYGDCVSMIYTMEEILGNIDTPWHERQRTMQAACNRILRDTHTYVDQNALVLHSATRYMLHRILLECRELVEEFSIPDRWDQLQDSLCLQELHFLGCHDRDVYLTGEQPDDIDCRIYLIDEISLAENMGFKDVVEPTEDEWDNLDNLGDLNGFGHNGCITPSMIAVDQLVECLAAVFRESFPEIFV
ncbi:MAG: hypothetical protein SO355_00445 [Candidatus Faecousia sp.]|nr:hypothetical protein [Candidatus Faecousia sp.]